MSPEPAPCKIGFRLIVEEQELLVDYQPNWSAGEFAFGHFEFKSPFDPPRRIPISETGYRSHFASMTEIASFESPEAFARQYVIDMLNFRRNSKCTEDGDEQLSLF